jgi:protein involved in polysaccharide export with SLBB domain
MGFDLSLYLFVFFMRILTFALLGVACTINSMAQSVLHPVSDYENTNAPARQASGAALYDKHLLEPGDQLSFQIMEDRKPSTNLVVTDSSEVSVPYVGRVSVAGKTCPQLSAELKALLEKDYYYRATVVVGLAGVNKVSGQVLIWGEVRTQGPVDILYGHSLTVSEAILRAGGLTDNADRRRVKIFRNEGGSSTRVIEVNIADAVENGKTEKDIVLEPNDYIVVPTKSIRF